MSDLNLYWSNFRMQVWVHLGLMQKGVSPLDPLIADMHTQVLLDILLTSE